MFDFCINGGGMVGATLALGLAQQQFKVAVIEPYLPASFKPGLKGFSYQRSIGDAVKSTWCLGTHCRHAC